MNDKLNEDKVIPEDTIEEHKDIALGGPVGWICPVCGRGQSPYSTYCPCRGWQTHEITCCRPTTGTPLSTSTETIC